MHYSGSRCSMARKTGWMPMVPNAANAQGRLPILEGVFARQCQTETASGLPSCNLLPFSLQECSNIRSGAVSLCELDAVKSRVTDNRNSCGCLAKAYWPTVGPVKERRIHPGGQQCHSVGVHETAAGIGAAFSWLFPWFSVPTPH